MSNFFSWVVGCQMSIFSWVVGCQMSSFFLGGRLSDE